MLDQDVRADLIPLEVTQTQSIIVSIQLTLFRMTDQTPLYSQIAEAIRRRIATGELNPGDSLPPVRAMANQWGCTPGTVNRAYRTLATEGLVVGRRGKGTYVTPSPVQPSHTAWGWADLVHRAEGFLLQAVSEGHDPIEIEAAFFLAVSRYNELRASQKTRREIPTTPQSGILRFAGSHDLAVEFVARQLSERPSSPLLAISFCGSLGGLLALASDEADLAGIHLWDEGTDAYNIPFVERIFPGRKMVLLTMTHRQLGLIVPRGNPQEIKELGDLARREILFSNRQAGSGTRVWLDAQLKKLAVQVEKIHGYADEHTTHLAVARAIAEGNATVGLGLYAAAASFGLDFIPLTKERYDLVIPAESMAREEIQFLLQMIRSPRSKATIGALGGYDPSEIGNETWLG